ncbi:MAG: hypothetical protein Q9225_002022 [Loekoesia sp. 1 TL-2023]
MPFLGHARAFVSTQDALLSHGREYFKNSRQPSFKDNTTLDYGLVIKDLMSSFGVSNEGICKVFEPSQDFIQKTQRYNPHGKTFFGLKSDFYHVALHPGPKFEATQQKFVTFLDDEMNFDKIPARVTLQATDRQKLVSLHRLCQQVFVSAGTHVFFGSQLLDLNPDVLEDFIKFDKNNWMVFYNWPQKAPASGPMQKVLATLCQYLDIPMARRPESAWVINMFEEAQNHLDVRKQDVAGMLMMLLWVINTNVYRVAFWMLTYIYRSEDLLSVIKDETAFSVMDDGSVNVQHLVKNFPRLDSIWFEVLRLTSAASAIRTILEPISIGGKTLRPGYKVISPFRQIHTDESVFGNVVDNFDPDRFLRDKTLANHPSYKPFGGGVTMCPGRFIARQEVYMFVTLILHRFDSQLADKNQAMPRFELGAPASGVFDPKDGDDVHVVITNNRLGKS